MGAIARGKGVLSGGGQRGENWDNGDSIINKIYFKNFKAMLLLSLIFKHIPIFHKNIKFRLTCNRFTVF